jgi:hypothetical protein
LLSQSAQAIVGRLRTVSNDASCVKLLLSFAIEAKRRARADREISEAPAPNARPVPERLDPRWPPLTNRSAVLIKPKFTVAFNTSASRSLWVLCGSHVLRQQHLM